jgi:hypothetical protein
MIIAKKPCDLMYCHTSGGISARRCVMSKSSTMRHSVSHGPSRKACSSADSFGPGAACNLRQSGLPVNSSPSHHTVPASSASRSVSDMAGSRRR